MQSKILTVGENDVKFSCLLRISVIGICVATKSCIFVQKPTRDKKDNPVKNTFKYIYQQAASIHGLRKRPIVMC